VPHRILFMGTPQFAVPTLDALYANGFDVVGVVCQPDKPAGRGQKLTPPPAKVAAVAKGIPVWQPQRLRDNPEFLSEIRALKPDLGVVIAYGKLLPQALLDLPTHGCVNLHASLLPKYRGAAPIEWALIRGEVETGVTLMKMDAGLDTGDMLARSRCLIEPQDNAATLAAKLSQLSAQVAVQEIPRWLRGSLKPEKQVESQATLAPLLTKATGQVNWSLSALDIEHLVRGVCVRPGAYTLLHNIPVKLRAVKALSKPCYQPPGTIEAISSEGWDVATGQQLLRVLELQLPGKPVQAAGDVARGWRELTPGDRFTDTSPPAHPSL